MSGSSRARPATRMLAHLSDLHLGRSRADATRAAQLCRGLREIGVDHVLVTGDITHRGRRAELDLFERAFAPLLADGRVTVVPGNHDRLGDDLGELLMAGARVQVAHAPGLYIVRVNSTGDHNRNWIAGHGVLHAADLVAIDQALDGAPAEALVVLALHHHVLPQAEDHAVERWASFMGLPFAAELARGRELLDRVRGRCALLLHGHRHRTHAVRLAGGARPLGVYNAGSSTLLGGVRVFEHAAGALVDGPWWLHASVTPDGATSWAAAPTAAVEPTILQASSSTTTV